MQKQYPAQWRVLSETLLERLGSCDPLLLREADAASIREHLAGGSACLPAACRLGFPAPAVHVPLFGCLQGLGPPPSLPLPSLAELLVWQ